MAPEYGPYSEGWKIILNTLFFGIFYLFYWNLAINPKSQTICPSCPHAWATFFVLELYGKSGLFSDIDNASISVRNAIHISFPFI
jgi:hypothetical protein